MYPPEGKPLSGSDPQPAAPDLVNEPESDDGLAGFAQLSRVRRAKAQTWGRIDGRLLAPCLIEIQPTARCHRVCSYCSHIHRNKRGGDLEPLLVHALLEAARELGVGQIAFSGGGEPLLWEPLESAVQEAAGFASVSLTTSGDQLFGSDGETLSPLALALLPHLSDLLLNIPGISDGSLAQQISGGPSWAHTRALLRELVGYRLGAGARYRVHVVVVVNRHNLPQLLAIDRELVASGIDQIYYKMMTMIENNRGQQRLKQDSGSILAALQAEPHDSWSPNLRRFVLSIAEQQPRSSPMCWVNRLGFTAIVDPSGDLYLCTPTVGDQQHRVGNVRDRDFMGLWGGAQHEDMIRRLNARAAAGNCPAACRFHPHNNFIEAQIGGTVAAGKPIRRAIANAGLDNIARSMERLD